MKFTYVFILFLVLGCAQVNPLTGGIKDGYAPQIDSSKTNPLSGKTNFKESKIEIRFKEYISLKNPNDNIIITPQLSEKPTIYAHNKKVTVEFNSELEENTTYTISFNHAVQDITEKNDSIFQFVFSTGDYIDSLWIEGNSSDAFTNVPNKDFLVALYPVESSEAQFDSVPYLLKPTYIGQTDAKGNFKINYLKEGIYYLFVFEDMNRNLLLDEEETFGFLSDETIHVSPKHIENKETYKELKTFHLEDVNSFELKNTQFTYPGKLTFTFSGHLVDGDFEISSTMDLLKEETYSDDSLVFWLANNPTAKMRFYTIFLGEIDTLKPLYKGMPDRGNEPDLTSKNNVSKGFLAPGNQLELLFIEPIESINKEKIHFYDIDSNQVNINWEISNYRKLIFNTLGVNARRVVIDSSAIQSIYGNHNKVSQQIIFENRDSSYFGSLIMNIDSLFESPVYIELINSKGETIRKVPFVQNLTFENLEPGKYQLRLIFDENNDLEWTSGSLKEKRQAEKVIYFNGEILIKSKWEKEFDWQLKI